MRWVQFSICNYFLSLAFVIGPLAAYGQSAFQCIENDRYLQKISGGSSVSIEDVSHHVSLWSGSQQICGGALLSPSVVLTAAHCVDHLDQNESNYPNFRVGYGDTKSNSVLRAIRSVEIHPGYRSVKGVPINDVALIQIDEPIRLQNWRPPVIATTRLEEVYGGIGACARVSGFGMMGEHQPPSEVLQAVNERVQPFDDCRAALGSTYGPLLDEGMICAGSPDDDLGSCKGDSGGALTVQGGGVGTVVVGVVSWGDGVCSTAGNFGVYARVSQYVDWIVDVTGRW